MGTEYSFLCLDCMEYWDMGKEANATHFLPELKKQHYKHRSLIVSDGEELDSLFSSYYLYLNGMESPYIRKDCFTELKATEGESQALSVDEVCQRSLDGRALAQAYQEVLEKTIDFNVEQQQKDGMG